MAKIVAKDAKDQVVKVIDLTLENLQQANAKADERERLILGSSKKRFDALRSAMLTEGWEDLLSEEALSSLQRTLDNDLERLDDERIKENRRVTIRSLVLGGLQMIMGLAGLARG